MKPMLILDSIVAAVATISQFATQDVYVRAWGVLLAVVIAIVGNVTVLVMKRYYAKSIVKDVVEEVYRVHYIEREKALEKVIAEQTAKNAERKESHGHKD